MWTTGQDWRVVTGLNKLNAQIRVYAPRAVPPATDADAWGAIADSVHSVNSDHYPHYYGFSKTAVVCARDFPHAPGLGLDGGVVTEHMRRARDSRVQYIIFNRRITGINYGWQWHTYTGDDPHNTHFHVSSVHSAVADSDAPWSLPGSSMAAASTPEGFDMDYIVKYTDNAATFLTNGVTARWLQDGDAVNYAMSLAKNGWNQLGNTYKNPTSPTVCVLGPEQKGGTLGRIVGPVPTGFEAYAQTSAPIDVQALADALATELNVDGSVVVAALQSSAGQAALQSGAFAGAQQAESQ